MRLFYTLSILLYRLAIGAASLSSGKAKLWIAGRSRLFERLEKAVKSLSAEELVWFHCASLGEFEQGRPLIEAYRKDFPSHKILLTFFSPSGFEIRKNYPGADLIFYLPLDTASNARRFISIVKPSKVFFVKYEFWFNFLQELEKNNIPVFLVSGIFRPSQHFFKPYGGWFRKNLRAFSYFFVQEERSAELLKSIDYSNVMITGDTRFDRVREIASQKKSIPLIESFCAGKPAIVAGSTWPQDEELIAELPIRNLDHKLIIAAHEVDKSHIQAIVARFQNLNVKLFSDLNQENAASADVLIIDNIGMLSTLYQYGKIAYIGGGFGKGIHNILEAAAFGLPVIFGPNNQRFQEAKDLLKLGGAFEIVDSTGLKKTIDLLQDKQVLETASRISSHYVQSRSGATARILSQI
jgi:3-deoxy-D-manno-octulosonic-acid transferase